MMLVWVKLRNKLEFLRSNACLSILNFAIYLRKLLSARSRR